MRLERTDAVVPTGDAINRAQEIEEDRYSGAWDGTLVRESARRVPGIARRETALPVYGHDPRRRGKLRKAPEYYD